MTNFPAALRVYGAIVAVVAVLCGWPVGVALAQDDPFGPDGEFPVRTPRDDLRVSLRSAGEGTDETNALSGRVDQIVDGGRTYKDDAVAIRRVLFENDITFEPRTYEMRRLKELLGQPPDQAGTISPDAEILFRYQAGDRFRTRTIRYRDIVHIDYPMTWLDIFADDMRIAQAQGISAHLRALEAFFDVHAAAIAEDFSESLRAEFHTQVLAQFYGMREREPSNVEVVIALGAYLAETGHFDAELAVYLEAVTRRVADPDGQMALRLGELYLNTLRLPEKALETLAGLPLASPQGLTACPLRGRAMIQTGQHIEAQIFLSDALRLLSELAEALEETPELASLMLPSTKSLNELFDEVRYLRGEAYLKNGKLYPAGVDFQSIPSTSPFYVRAQLSLATVHFYSRDYPAATTILRGGRGGLPGIGDAIANAARDEDPVNDPKYDIYADGQPEVPYDAQSARALCLLANVILAQRMDEAVRQAQQRRQQQARQGSGTEIPPLRATDVRPNPDARVGRYALRAMRHDPLSDEPFLVLAEHAMRTGGSALAAQWIERANRINPTNSMQFYRMGYYLAREENFVGAIRQLRRAVELAPDFLDAYVMLGELYYRLTQNLNERMQREGASEADIRERDELLKHAIAYFKNALGIDTDRIDVKLKLGHCYLERAQVSAERAATLKGQWDLRRDIETEGRLREMWNTVLGDLEKAAEQFDMERFSSARVIDVVPGTPPQVIIDAGALAGVTAGMTFELLKDGPPVTLRVASAPTAFAASCVPENETDLFVRDAISRLQPGDRVGNALAADNKRERRIIYPRQTLIARSAMGYVYYLRDFIAGAQAQVEGRDAGPTPDLDRARKEWRFVIRYVKDYPDAEYNADPAYLSSLRNYLALRRQARRVQWTDEFDRTRSGGGLDVVGQDWTLNLNRDADLAVATSEANSHLKFAGRSGTGKLTTITRLEDWRLFSGVQIDLNVVPARMVPQGLDGRVGLILSIVPVNAPPNATAPTILVTMDADGRFYQQIGEWRPGQGTDVVVGEETPLSFRIYGPQVNRKIRTIRLERRLGDTPDQRNLAKFFLVIDERMEAELAVPDGPFTRLTGASANDRLRVGVAVAARPRVAFDVEFDAVRIIRERSVTWAQEENRMRDDPTIGDDD